jgi:hypothetical protein
VLVERAKAAGQPLRRLTLPAFDGQELEVAVTNADLAPSGLSGTFTGQLPGRGQSLVTLAFSKGHEAFTVVSPEDGTFLQGHPREPGRSSSPVSTRTLTCLCPAANPSEPTKPFA